MMVAPTEQGIVCELRDWSKTQLSDDAGGCLCQGARNLVFGIHVCKHHLSLGCCMHPRVRPRIDLGLWTSPGLGEPLLACTSERV